MVRRACVMTVVAVALFLVDADARRGQSAPVLAGVVRVEETGRPLPGARLGAVRGGTGVGQAVSDEHGRFSITVPDDADVDLTVTKAGWAPFRMSLRSVPAAEPLDVRLTPGSVISGRVFDGIGAPAGGMNVRVRRVPEPGESPGAWRTVSTNDLGEYRIGSLPAGEYEVAMPVRDAQPAVVRLQPGRESRQDLVRPENPIATPQALAQTAEAMARLFLGQPERPPVDPETAGRLSGVVTGPDVRPARDDLLWLVAQESAAAPGCCWMLMLKSSSVSQSCAVAGKTCTSSPNDDSGFVAEYLVDLNGDALPYAPATAQRPLPPQHPDCCAILPSRTRWRSSVAELRNVRASRRSA